MSPDRAASVRARLLNLAKARGADFNVILDGDRRLPQGIAMAKNKMEPIHPGEILAEEFLGPLAITQYRLAKEISVPARRINEIVQGKRGISADTALRLSRYFGTSERFWVNLQAHYDLEVEKDKLGSRLEKEVVEFKRAG